ncbi:MAG: histidine triad nucleotide-binding protein [Thermoflexales bacterium]|nr:histidine triad nucleotide-binding protein [Thermoflexales bacterium]
MSNCLFCKIASGDIPATIVYRGPNVLAFRDIAPQAPTHILVIPVKHLASVAVMQSGDVDLVGNLIATAAKIAESEGLQQGYRLVINTGSQGGQSVDHVHVHILGGRQMTWPPG